MYSPTPALSDVLFYTPSDSYNFMTDNRPIYQLDSNIRALATSLVGAGYGEHASISGGVLTPGHAVELLATGLIKYPDSTTVAGSAVIGLVIGASGAGLTRVIWGATLLDLDVLGLAGIISGSTPGQFIVSAADSTGNISLVTSFTSSSLVVGSVRNNTYISVGYDGLPQMNADPTPEYNSLNNYGVTRKRNFEMLQTINAAPLQFTKKTTYQSDAPFASTINPLRITYSVNTGQILPDITADPTYGVTSSWIVKETYQQFVTSTGTDSILIGTGSSAASTWPTIAFQPSFSSGIENYELQAFNSSLDFTIHTGTFKAFTISKYYQYARVAASSPLYGKVMAIVTVFDPTYGGATNLGGETSIIIVCDFFSYNGTNGYETQKNRIVVTGNAADTLYSNTNIFSTALVTAGY